MKHLLFPTAFAAACLVLSPLSAPAAETTTVDWFNSISTLFLNQNGIPLTQGAAGVNQDGTLVQLGYFSLGTVSDPFAGTWIPLTLNTTVGDSFNLTGSGDGGVAFNTFFTSGSSTVEVYVFDFDAGAYTTSSTVAISSSLPANNQILAVRFFNSNLGLTGRYNTVSSSTWLWQSPTLAGSSVTLNIGGGGLVWEDSANPLRTSIPVPEPGTIAISFACLGLVAVHTLRRRKR